MMNQGRYERLASREVSHTAQTRGAWRRCWRWREAEGLWETEGRLLLKEIREVQIMVTK